MTHLSAFLFFVLGGLKKLLDYSTCRGRLLAPAQSRNEHRTGRDRWHTCSPTRGGKTHGNTVTLDKTHVHKSSSKTRKIDQISWKTHFSIFRTKGNKSDQLLCCQDSCNCSWSHSYASHTFSVFFVKKTKVARWSWLPGGPIKWCIGNPGGKANWLAFVYFNLALLRRTLAWPSSKYALPFVTVCPRGAG